MALWRITGRAGEAVPALVLLLRAKSSWIGPMAAVRLGEMGPLAGAALPDLRGLLGSDSPELRTAARRALVEIEGTPGLLPGSSGIHGLASRSEP
jgi:hypothetical protein